jgi:hypothetical protein
VRKRKTSDFSSEEWGSPRYMRDLVWEDNYTPGSAAIAMTADAPPIPGPPQSEFTNHAVSTTIAQHPHLFAIVTPINVDHLQFLLSRHPN